MSRVGNLLGQAGVHLVAAELCLRGWKVAPTVAGTTRTDLLAQRQDGSTCAIQVKTRARGDFQIGDPAAATAEADEWFVLVNRPTISTWPQCNVLPRNHLVAAVRVYQAICDARGEVWKRKGLLGEQEFQGYRDAWELMEKHARDAPWRMPDWVTNWLHEHPEPDLALPRLVSGPERSGAD